MIIGFLCLLSLINYIGIKESIKANVICTIIEVIGLSLVIFGGIYHLLNHDGNHLQLTFNFSKEYFDMNSVMTGAILAFFSFLGFEDLVNIAEEAKNPRKHLPIALFIALMITGIIYFLVTSISTSVVSPPMLADSDAPLLLVIQKSIAGFPLGVFSIIAVFAISNTALLNNIMTSRLLYGMSNEKLVNHRLAVVSKTRGTPHNSILFILFCTTFFTLTRDLQFLAQTTILLILTVS